MMISMIHKSLLIQTRDIGCYCEAVLAAIFPDNVAEEVRSAGSGGSGLAVVLSSESALSSWWVSSSGGE